jgi:hypothetical protein
LDDEKTNSSATRTWDDWSSKQPVQSKASSSTGNRGNKVGFTMSDFGSKFGKEEKSKGTSGWGQTSSQHASSQEESSSSALQDSSSTEHRTSSDHSSTMERTSDGRLKAGELLFTMPSFGGGASELLSPGDCELSPMTTRDEKSDSQQQS